MDLDTLCLEAVRLQPPSRQARYLLHARKEACPYCTTGERSVTFWVTPRGKGEEVSWCEHCFNALCLRVPLDEDLQMRHAAVRQALREGRVSRRWLAARPAVADLERRGLL